MEQSDDAVTVCICTYRRPRLMAAVRSIIEQKDLGSSIPKIVVVDNDDTPSARARLHAFCEAQNVDVTYVHAPAHNISIARNAAIDATTTRWLAFIDDDEVAAPNWIARLCAARHSAVAVFGISLAVYPGGTASWIKRGDFHSNFILDKERPIKTGYSSNVIIDLDFVRRHKLRFDISLGQTGGEDTLFFYSIYGHGGTLKFAPDAVVYDDVAPSRLSFRWIATRKFRGGQVYAMMFDRSIVEVIAVSRWRHH